MEYSPSKVHSSLFYKQLFIAVLLIKATLMTFLIKSGQIGLGPDEAQYWTWSRELDWGYYSKPPGIAWQIWLGTQLFGQTEWGVRFISVVLSIAQAGVVYLLAQRARLSPLVCLSAGLLMALSPIGILGSLFAVTDGGCLFFWTCCCLVVVSALAKQQEADPLYVGLCILCGALFKWPIYLFWLFFLLARFFYFPTQRLTQVLVGMAISLLGLLPSLWWNLSHDWATFRHVSATVQGGSAAQAAKGNFLEFIGSQGALASPLLFIFLIAALVCVLKGKKWKELPVLAWSSLVTCAILGGLTIASLFQKIQGNWSLLAYPTAFLILGWYLSQELYPKGIKWLSASLAISVGLTAVLLSLPFWPAGPSLYHKNPLKHNMGWQSLEKELRQLGYDPQKHFLVSDKYQTTSELSFYSPGQKKAYFLNLQGVRKNQFCYWPCLQEKEQGRSGYFIWIENSPHLQREEQAKKKFYEQELRHYFEEVEQPLFIPLLKSEDQILKGTWIFKCHRCREEQPEQPALY